MTEPERIRRAHAAGLQAFKKLSKKAQLKRFQELGIVDASGALTVRYGGKRRAAKKKKAG